MATSKRVLTDAEALRAGEGRRRHHGTLSSWTGLWPSRSGVAVMVAVLQGLLGHAPGGGASPPQRYLMLMFFVLSRYLFSWFKKNDK